VLQFEAVRRYAGVVVPVLPTTAVVVGDGNSGFKKGHDAACRAAHLWTIEDARYEEERTPRRRKFTNGPRFLNVLLSFLLHY
jgi:hypothetical protein